MDNEQVIGTLNNLLAITKDGGRGFRFCVGDVTSPHVKKELEAAARRCVEGAVELQMKIRSLGGEPAAYGTLDRHRAENHGMGDRAVLDECKRGETVAKQAMKKRSWRTFPPTLKLLCAANTKRCALTC
jgi:uncharacterized protein (TIGR02284 family)